MGKLLDITWVNLMEHSGDHCFQCRTTGLKDLSLDAFDLYLPKGKWNSMSGYVHDFVLLILKRKPEKCDHQIQKVEVEEINH